MPRTTSQQIGDAISAATGDLDVKVVRARPEGYRFDSSNPETSAVIEGFKAGGIVHADRLGDLPVETWVATWKLKRQLGRARALGRGVPA